MELEPLEPLIRFFAVDHAVDLTGLSDRIPGSGFLCYYPNDEEYGGFLDGTGRLWLRGDDAPPAEELLDVLVLCFGRDENGVPFSEQTTFDAATMPLPITVVELD